MFVVILDVGDSKECQMVNFDINSDSTVSTSRSWDIKVTQYDCSSEDNAGKFLKKVDLDSKLFLMTTLSNIRASWLPSVFHWNFWSHCQLCLSYIFGRFKSTWRYDDSLVQPKLWVLLQEGIILLLHLLFKNSWTNTWNNHYCRPTRFFRPIVSHLYVDSLTYSYLFDSKLSLTGYPPLHLLTIQLQLLLHKELRALLTILRYILCSRTSKNRTKVWDF